MVISCEMLEIIYCNVIVKLIFEVNEFFEKMMYEKEVE